MSNSLPTPRRRRTQARVATPVAADVVTEVGSAEAAGIDVEEMVPARSGMERAGGDLLPVGILIGVMVLLALCVVFTFAAAG